MASHLVESKVEEAVRKNAPYAVGMITRWIIESLTSNDFQVTDIDRAKFVFVSNDVMSFSAVAQAYVGEDFDEAVIANVSWTKSGSSLNREFRL